MSETHADPAVPEAIRELMEIVRADGGVPLSAYREPKGGHWQVFGILPIDRVQPTPYQRDRSPAHVKRLQAVIERLDRFIDPVVVVRTREGEYWIPNGAHRHAALKNLKVETIPVILIPETEVAYRILALNTEKAHNLKEKSLEVIRMYRDLIARGARADESAYAFEFEEPQFATLGLAYEEKPRISGSVYSPILKRVDGFLDTPLPEALEGRAERARRVIEADDLLTGLVDAVRERGVQHPFVKAYIMARCNPLGRGRKGVPQYAPAFSTLIERLRSFDPASVRLSDMRAMGPVGEA
jgi:ParB family chromosome partitioning protein